MIEKVGKPLIVHVHLPPSAEYLEHRPPPTKSFKEEGATNSTGISIIDPGAKPSHTSSRESVERVVDNNASDTLGKHTFCCVAAVVVVAPSCVLGGGLQHVLGLSLPCSARAAAR